MLTLDTPTSVFLSNANTRKEHHGEALVDAIDLAFSWKTNNRALDMIHPQLREALFDAVRGPDDDEDEGDDEDEDDQKKMDLPVDELAYLAFPKLKYPLKFEGEQTGMTATIVYGLGGKSNIVLHNGVVKSVKVTPIEGGSVQIDWTLSSNVDIDERIMGKCGALQQRDIDFLMLGPDVAQTPGQKPDLGHEGDWPFPEDGEKPAQTATEAFVAAHGTDEQTSSREA